MATVTAGHESAGEPGGGQRQLASYAAHNLGATYSDGVMKRLVRRKLVFIGVFLVTAALVFGAYCWFPATYKAEALVTVTASDPLLGPGDGRQNATVGDTDDLESQSQILSSPLLLRELLNSQAVYSALFDECRSSGPPFWKAKLKAVLLLKPAASCREKLADVPALVENLRSHITVMTVGRSRVLSVAYTSTSATTAQFMADGLVQVYLDHLMRDKLQPRDAAITWLRGEIKGVGDRLKESDTQIDGYLHSNGVVRGQTASIASERLTGLAQQIGIAEAEQAASAGRMEQAQAGGSETSAVLDNRAIGDIKQRLASVTADIAAFSSRYGVANPKLVELIRQRDDLERLLIRETGIFDRSARADHAAATARIGALRQEFDALKREVQGNDDATTQIAALRRNAGMDRDLLVDLTKNLNQLETDRKLVVPDAKLISWAEPPQSIFFPKRSIFVAAGALLAAAMAIFITLLVDQADHTVHKVSELEDAVDLPVIARVPFIAWAGRGSSQLNERIESSSSFQEAIRGLYAECYLMNSRCRRPLRSFLVTSSDCNEGKSLTALALAQFAAVAGRKVLLLECDLRRPTIGRSLGLTAGPGMSEVLKREIDPASAIQVFKAPGPSLLLAGVVATNSAELLGSDAMTELLDWAVAHYDMVILDTPPARILPDARILASSVDCVLYCARWGHSVRDAVAGGVRDIREAGGHVLGLVLGRVNASQYRLYNGSSASLHLPVLRSS